ncbi:MAG: AMP-binding protein [Myxococcota bacterium]|nr:AMP-binding protein [Myxococcota bacterium]
MSSVGTPDTPQLLPFSGRVKGPLSVREQLTGKTLFVMGGTGFLGKVWLCLLLDRFPEVEHIYMVVRQRKRKDGSIKLSSHDRFWEQVASSEVFDPLRDTHGDGYDDFLKQKITPIPGDVSEDFAGVPQEIRDQIRGKIDVLVNVAGIVDFTPPLDYALNANAFGMQNLIALCKDLGPGCKMMHTSTCYVAGDRTGQVDEVDPKIYPFPKADELDPSHWDPAREIAECVDMVEHVRHRANDAFRQSDFLDQAKANLKKKGEPTRGSVLKGELEKVRRRFIDNRLRDDGMERAKFWGWHNTYTYTKSIGEQLLCHAGLEFCIVRPAVIESAVEFPRVGWCEGINTSAPLILLAMKSPIGVPANKESVLDIIPVDMVAAGMVLSLAELCEGTHEVVYQYGSSDSSPLGMYRLIELVGLHKRQWKLEHSDNPLMGQIEARLEAHPTTVDRYRSIGPEPISKVAKSASDLLKRFGGPLAPLTKPASKQLAGFSKSMNIQGRILDIFVPFTATHSYRFSCQNTRAALARCTQDEQALIPWKPETIDWRDYILNVHGPGLQENVAPELEEKLKKPLRALRAYDSLLDLQDEIAERHDLRPALLVTHEDGFQALSFAEFRNRSMAAARRLIDSGVKPGDKVMLSADNHPDWAVSFFGILRAGAIAVPVEAGMAPLPAANIQQASGAVLAILDETSREAFAEVLSIPVQDIHALCEDGAIDGLPELGFTKDDLASILYTSGTTGVPKGVMLSHGNFTELIGSLAATFPLKDSDRLLSVLPMHHTFEFTCGLLLPLSRGARVYYLDELTGERLTYGLKEGKVTAMVGVPALWQLLERRIRGQVSEKGKVFETAFDASLELNRIIGKQTGLDLGRVMFGQVHDRLGGNIRFLISGAAALPKQTQELFQGLGLHLAEGYGLTEAAPVLTVAKGKPGAKAGHVGKPVPGVEVKILNPDKDGIGEIVARGPNVMQGYFNNEEATGQAIQDGWLHTGDLGKIDHRGNLSIMGRAKEVVVTASGENIYLDDVENTLGPDHDYVKEYGLVGIPDPRGGERLGMLAVADLESHKDLDRATVHAKAKESLQKAIKELPGNQRPAVIHLVDADLPRTKTRKVQRKEVKKVLEKIQAATITVRKGESLAGPVAEAIASVAGVSPDKVTTTTHMVEELAFDSLMWVELASALDAMGAGSVDADDLQHAETVADVLRMAKAPRTTVEIEEDVREKVELPDVVAEPLKAGLGFLQRELYQTALNCKIYGRAYIPQNRQTIVVSNHCSHLDMGLVKYALGQYGYKLVALAAQDYFFEGNKYVVAYFERLTNLQPIDRKRGFRASLRQAIDVVRAGNVVLLFPEGTRRTDGTIGEFRPLVGWLSMETNVDILPMHLDGTFDAMPKGAVLPRGRDLSVRIGPALEVREVKRLTKGMKPAMAARHAARLSQRAVEALRDGDVLDLRQLEPQDLEDLGQKRVNPVEEAFGGLAARLIADRVKKPVSWYFSLGGKEGARYHVIVNDEGATVAKGKPPGGAADCVVKTSEEMMRKILVDGYTPEPPEFFSGAIKTNDIPLLIELSRVFGLTEVQA